MQMFKLEPLHMFLFLEENACGYINCLLIVIFQHLVQNHLHTYMFVNNIHMLLVVQLMLVHVVISSTTFLQAPICSTDDIFEQPVWLSFTSHNCEMVHWFAS